MFCKTYFLQHSPHNLPNQYKVFIEEFLKYESGS